MRTEMLWASLLGMPFGFIDFFLIPAYWHPDSLFGLMEKYGLGIESFIFAFFMIGIASVVYKFLFRKTPVKLHRNSHAHFLLLILASFSFVAAAILFPTQAVYYLMEIGAAGTAIVAYLRRDLIKEMFMSAFIFSFLYLAVFILINFIFKGFVEYSYNLANLWGIYIVGVPLEEVGVAFFIGAFWSVLYEYTKDYREIDVA